MVLDTVGIQSKKHFS